MTSKKQFSLSGLFGFLEGKGVKVKLNENTDDEDKQFELIEEETEETDPVKESSADPIAQFSAEDVAGMKSLLAAFNGAEPAVVANALKEMPTVLKFIQKAGDVQKAEKTTVINRIKANSASLFTDEELESLPITVLHKMDAQADVNYMAAGGGQQIFENAEDDGALQPKSSFMAMAEQESA